MKTMRSKKKNKTTNTTRPEPKCSPNEFSIKSYFLAPNAENRQSLLDGVQNVFEQWFNWRSQAHSGDGPFFTSSEFKNKKYRHEQIKLQSELENLSQMFAAEIPRHSPRYIGHMYSDYTIPAFFGHILALMYNPNNISSESSRVGIKIEQKAVRALCKMIGYPLTSKGHFTSGGTIANFEMLYRSKMYLQSVSKKPKPLALIVPESAHYSWEKGLRLIGDQTSKLFKVRLDHRGTMDTDNLEHVFKLVIQNNFHVLGVVSVLGSTELGTLDPVHEIHKITRSHEAELGYRVWHHVDAAYGGFFAAVNGMDIDKLLDPRSISALKSLLLADSITLDPHKLGYVPYASGCFLCRDHNMYLNTNLLAPYLDYKSSADPGPFTIEGSRTAAGPLAIYLTDRTIGLGPKGLGTVLKKTLENARALKKTLEHTGLFSPLEIPMTNIVDFSVLEPSKLLSEMNKFTLKFYEKSKLHKKSTDAHFYVSKTTLGSGHNSLIQEHCSKLDVKMDSDHLVLIRCTMMNPFFRTQHAKVNLTEEFAAWAQSLC